MPSNKACKGYPKRTAANARSDERRLALSVAAGGASLVACDEYVSDEGWLLRRGRNLGCGSNTLCAVVFICSTSARATGNLYSDQKVLRAGLVKLVEGLELGARNAVAVSMACAVAGIIVGIVGLTGIGLKFSAMMLAFSGGNILLALIMVLLASLVLGMGLPVTASYIVLIVLVGPALTQEFGVPLLVAHLVVFWYSQDSNVTPPIALAGFAGAAIAGSGPMETSFQAWKFAKGLYLIPLFMVFKPEIIMGGPVLLVIWSGLIGLVALGAFAAALEVTYLLVCRGCHA